MDFMNEANSISDMLINIRRNLHMHPELDRDLNYTSSFIEEKLNEMGIKNKRYRNCGIIAEVGNGNNIVALRADMDALPIIELNEVPYKSKNNGKMHACGHDAHTTILIGAAYLLKKIEDKLKGKVRFIFQPAEETDGGAIDMISLGCLDGVSAICGLHVEENIECGTIGINYGEVSASSNPFSIKVNGKGAHGAHPESSVDAIFIACKIVSNLQAIISREISPFDNAVISIGKIHGGTAQNAICSEVLMDGIVRTLDIDIKRFILKRIKEVAECTAALYRGSAQIEFIESYPSFKNNNELFDFTFNLFSKEKNISTIKLNKPSMGVEDFAYYIQKIPGIFYRLGCKNEKLNITNPAHGSYFDIDENCLSIGCALQTTFAYNYLLDKEN